MTFEFFNRDFQFFGSGAQIEKFVDFIFSYLMKPSVFFAVFTSVVFLFLLLIFKVALKDKAVKVMLDISPWLYLLIILSLSLFNRDGSIRELRLYFDPWIASDVSFHESNIIIFVLDFIYFLPFGILLQWRLDKFWVTSLTVVLTGLSVEILQYVLSAGVSSISDLTAYISGGLLGAAIIILGRRVTHRHSHSQK